MDCDPYGFANIYRTLKAGSGNAAHINQFYSVPRARFLGVTPRDIVDYGLEDATHPLTKADINRAHDAIKNDPFFGTCPGWIAAIDLQHHLLGRYRTTWTDFAQCMTARTRRVGQR